MDVRRTVVLCTLPLALAAGRATLRAQQVHGTARAGATTDASPPASPATSVILLDSAGRVAAGAVTDSSGRYSLRAPAAGTYRVRARRIGFSPDSSVAISLHAGQRVTYDPVLRAFTTRLATVRVGEAERCRIAPDAGALAHRLWEDAQSALTATVVGAEQRETGFILRRFERELDPDGMTVRTQQSWDSRTVSSEPYASVTADSLAAHGFVVPSGHSLIYYAPDARTLTSDAFARGHCFRPTERANRPSDIGLAFAPVRARGDAARRDVSGVLWLDRATGELRDLEFSYDAAASTDTRASTNAATGRVEYRRLPHRTWIVDHWLIHMPVVATHTVMAPRTVPVIGEGTALTPETVATVTAIWEAGGDVTGTYAASDSAQRALATSGSVTGRFVDTVRGANSPTGAVRVEGVRGLRVSLTPRESASDANAAYTAVSDPTGAFAIEQVAPGAYTVRVSGDALDTLDVAVPDREIAVAAATSQSLLTVLPSQDAIIRHLCTDGLRDDESVVHGSVRDGDARSVPHARVTLTWFDVTDTHKSHFIAHVQTRTTIADADGRYVICAVPRDDDMLVTASLGTRKTPPVTLKHSAHAVMRLAPLRFPVEHEASATSADPTGRRR